MSFFARGAKAVFNLFRSVGITEEEVEFALIEAGVEAEMLALADEVEEYWQNLVEDLGRGSAPDETEGAPEFGRRPPKRGEPAFGSVGDYKNSIRVHIDHNRGVPDVRVGTDDPKAHWLEYGSIHNPEHGYAQRTADHFHGEVDLHMEE